MVYLLLSATAMLIAAQDILKQKFNKRCSHGTFLFSGLIALFAMIFFLSVNREWYFDAKLMIPAVAFAVSYAMATVFLVLAVRYGSLAKTSLIISCSLLVPAFYGMVFLDELISATLLLGIAFLVVALVLINYQKEDSDKKTTLKWWIFVMLAFVGNGMCSTVQKIKPIYFGDGGNNVYMAIALAIVTVVMLTLSLSSSEERPAAKETLRRGWLFAMLNGFANGLSNFLVIFLNTKLPASVMFPVMSAGSVTIALVYSVLVCRERFSVRQFVGFVIGIVSIILLNL